MKHLFASALLLTSALTVAAQTDPIRIDLGQKGAVVSPNLYGIFFEEIIRTILRSALSLF